MGCFQSVQTTIFVEDIYNGFLKYFKFLESKTWNLHGFHVSSLEITQYSRPKESQEIIINLYNILKVHLSLNFSMLDEIFLKNYVTRKLMCDLFNVSFVEPKYYIFDSSNELKYIDSLTTNSEYQVQIAKFKEQFYKSLDGIISFDTIDPQNVNYLQQKLLSFIADTVKQKSEKIKIFMENAISALEKYKQK